MTVRMKVVDNKQIEMTDAEFAEFEKICKASDRPNYKGEELFRDRFVTDDNGRIIYLKALGNRYVSFEAVFFLMNLMQNQHMRAMYTQIIELSKKIDEKMAILNQKEKLIDEKLAKI
jgi:hypothetical protein